MYNVHITRYVIFFGLISRSIIIEVHDNQGDEHGQFNNNH